MRNLNSLAGLLGLAYLLAVIIDKFWLTTDEQKSKILAPLQKAGYLQVLKSSPESFAFIFDHIFGKNTWSWQRFTRSSIASFSSVFIVSFIWWITRPDQLTAFLKSGTIGEVIFSIYIIFSFTNLLPDYISLVETRWLIQKMRFASNLRLIFFYLGIDLLITPFIFLGSIVFGLLLFNIFTAILPHQILFFSKFAPRPIEGIVIRVIEHQFTISDYISWFTHFTGNAIPLTTDNYGEPSPGIWFYTTFFTSILAWFYGLSLIVAKIVNQISKRFINIINTSACKDNPVQCLTGQLIIFAVFLYFLFALVHG